MLILLTILVPVTWLTFIVTVAVYYEMRRADRIRRGIPLDDQPPHGFEVQQRSTPSAPHPS